MTKNSRSSETIDPDTGAVVEATPFDITPRGVSPEALARLAEENPRVTSSDELDIDRLLDAEQLGWRPEPGDKLVGTVVNIEIGGQGSAFGTYPLLTIVREDTGEPVMLHAFHTVLRMELGRKGVGVGDRIGVKYLGQKDGGDFGSYEAYRVVVSVRGAARLTIEQVSR